MKTLFQGIVDCGFPLSFGMVQELSAKSACSRSAITSCVQPLPS